MMLSATESYSAAKITIYLADKDRHNNPIPDIESWIAAGMELLADINGGVTRLPWSTGIWIEKSENGEDDKSYDNTTLIYSFVRDEVAFIAGLDQIEHYLHDYGRETNQGEVLFEYYEETQDGRLYHGVYGISEYHSRRAE